MLLTILTFIIVLGILVFVHELGHFLAAKQCGVRVDEFAFGFKPTLFKKKIGETTYMLNLWPVGGYVRMYGEDGHGEGKKSFTTKSAKQKLYIIVAGVIMNLILGWLILTTLFMTGFQPIFYGTAKNHFVTGKQTVSISEVADGSPAALAGLKVDDQLLAINGEDVATTQEFIVLVAQHKGETVRIKIVRDNQQGEVSLIPRVDPPAGQGAVGVTLASAGDVRSVWYKAPLAGAVETYNMAVVSAQGFIGFVNNILVHQKVSDDVTGIVGVGVMTGEARKLGFSYLAQLVAVISIGLGVINLVPLIPLDGGQAVIITYERITKRKLTERQLSSLFIVGIAFVIGLFLVVTYKDFVRFDILGRIF